MNVDEDSEIEISDNEDDDDDDMEIVVEEIPKVFKTAFTVEYQFGSKSFCSFGNMANA